MELSANVGKQMSSIFTGNAAPKERRHTMILPPVTSLHFSGYVALLGERNKTCSSQEDHSIEI